MRLATFIPPGGDEPRAGEVRDDEVVSFDNGTVLDRMASGDRAPATGQAFPLAEVTLLAPIPRPRAIFGIGRNYAAHAAELGNELPDKPMVFMKLPTSSAPPSGPVRCPAVVSELGFQLRFDRLDQQTQARLEPIEAFFRSVQHHIARWVLLGTTKTNLVYRRRGREVANRE